jgi:hypothetical protein
MFKIDEEVESRPDYRIGALAFDVRHEADTAGVVFVARAVQALRSLVTNVFGASIHGCFPNLNGY